MDKKFIFILPPEMARYLEFKSKGTKTKAEIIRKAIKNSSGYQEYSKALEPIHEMLEINAAQIKALKEENARLTQELRDCKKS